MARSIPSIIMQPLRFALQVPVTSPPVHINTCIGRSIPVQIESQPRIPVLADIIISTIQSSFRRKMSGVAIKDFPVLIGYQAAYPLYPVVIERMAQRNIDIEFGTEIAICNIKSMTFLTLQIRISLTDKHRVLIVKIRIQVPDSRTPDTHIITCAQILRLTDFHPQRDRRNQVTVVRMKILTRTYNIFHPLYGLLVTDTRLERKVLILQGISRIGRQDMVQMAVLTAAAFVVHIIIASACRFIEPVVAAVASENILRSRLNRMQFTNRSGIVHLKSLLHRIRLTIRMVVSQPQPFNQVIFLPIGEYIQISVVGIISLRLRIYLIGQGNHPFLVFSGSTLIVYISIHGIP